MGKMWDPATTVSWNRATTALSNIVSVDESPLLEGLLYVGTDDGLLQVTENGGKIWRRVETFPGVPPGTYVTDVVASPRDANVVFVALNNWQRGDYKPYLLKSIDRGRTFTSVAGNLPDRHPVWAVNAGPRQQRLDLRRHRVRAVLHGRRRAALGAAQGRPAGRADPRHGRAEARDGPRPRHVRPQLLRARRLQRASRGHARPRSPRRRGSSRCATRISSRRSASSGRAATTGPRRTRRTAPCSRITCGRTCRPTRGSCSRSPTRRAGRFGGSISTSRRVCGAWRGTSRRIRRRRRRARRTRPRVAAVRRRRWWWRAGWTRRRGGPCGRAGTLCRDARQDHGRDGDSDRAVAVLHGGATGGQALS